MSTNLKVSERKDLKHSTVTQIRREGHFPAVVYGKDKPNRNIYVNEQDFMKAIRETGRNGILDLQLDGNTKEQVMLQDIQTDPLKGEIVHADFFIVDMQSEVDVEVAIHLTGEAQGVKDGGILQQPLHQISVRALPGNIPETIEIDISTMGIGDTLQVRDLKEGRQYELTDDEETVIASILPPNTEEKLESGEVQDGGDLEVAENTEEKADKDA